MWTVFSQGGGCCCADIEQTCTCVGNRAWMGQGASGNSGAVCLQPSLISFTTVVGSPQKRVLPLGSPCCFS